MFQQKNVNLSYLLIVRALSLREARGERPTVSCVMGEARTARA
jgi:hypothetical protein